MRTLFLSIFFLLVIVRFAVAQAPDFIVTDSDGKTHHLYADYVQKGKVVVFEIFFVGCPPCAAHAPHIQNLYQSVQNDFPGRVEFFLLSDKVADTNPLVAQYKTGKALTMPVVGSDGGSLAAVQPYKSGQFGPYYGTPTFVIIAPGTGEVIYDVRGNSAAATMSLIRQEIADLLPTCRIQTPQGDTLLNYTLTVSTPGGGTAVSQQVTNGAYSLENFPNLPALPFYEVVPTKNDNPLNGVSTFDLVQINRQILGIEPFQHAWQYIAADANNSGSVTTFDIVELRRLILGIYDTLPQVPSWVFSPAKDTLWPVQCPEILAIKKGDVNGNANAKNLQFAEPREATPRPILLENNYLTAGHTHTIQLRAGSSGAWAGFQAALRYNADALQIKHVRSGVLPGLDENAWHVSNGRLTLSWIAPGDPVAVSDRLNLLEIEILALRDGPLSAYLQPEDMPMRSEGYDTDGSAHPLDWRVTSFKSDESLLVPNPARGFFAIRLDRGAPGRELIQLIDVQGKVVYEKILQLEKGLNSCEVIPGRLSAGMYSVRVGGQVIGRLVWEN